MNKIHTALLDKNRYSLYIMYRNDYVCLEMPKKDYVLTDHVKQRMKARRISEEELLEVLINPDYTYPGTEGETSNVKTINERRIRVVFKVKRSKKIIITAIVI